MNNFKKILIFGLFLIVGTCNAKVTNSRATNVVDQGCDVFNQVCEQLKTQPLSYYDYATITKIQEGISASSGTIFTEEELINAIGIVLDGFDEKLIPGTKFKLNTIKDDLIKRLRGFNVTGFAFAIDPNGAFFVDTQDPEFDMIFKNSAGEVKSKRIKADIESIGIKIELAINLNCIFFVGTDLNYLDASDKIDLGRGLEIGFNILSGFNVLYAPFKNATGGMLMFTIGFGFPGLSLSLVTGGKLTPVN